MKSAPLTMKQEAFCREYVRNGGNGTQAYASVYNSTSRQAANVESTKMLKDQRIIEYIKRLKQPLEAHAIQNIVNQRDKKRALLWQRIAYCRVNNDDSNLARYVDILNKMDAEYVNIQKVEDNRKAQLVRLNTQQLRKLADM